MGTRIAVFTDTHANLPALQAALTAVRQAGCDAVYHTGDAVAIGPFPRECVDLLLSQDVRCVAGNHDLYVVNGIPNPPPAYMSEGEVRHQKWVRTQLPAHHRAVMATWPMRRTETIAGVRITFVHYGLSPDGRSYQSVISQPSAADLDDMFNGMETDLIFYGHNHAASDVQGRARYVNPGALGCQPTAVAPYVLLTLERGSYSLTHHATTYDDAPLIAAYRQRCVPDQAHLNQHFFGGRLPI